MRPPPLIQAVPSRHSPESLAAALRNTPGLVVLRSALPEVNHGRYSLVAVRPFLRFRSWGARCELTDTEGSRTWYGDPWALLDAWMARYEMLDAVDRPFPLGGCLGWWGYDLKNFTEPRLPRQAVNDLELPDCDLGFYASLVVFDHVSDQTWVVATGLQRDGSRRAEAARQEAAFWTDLLQGDPHARSGPPAETAAGVPGTPETPSPGERSPIRSSLPRAGFLDAVRKAQSWIRLGHIYQVNLSQRLSVASDLRPWRLFLELSRHSPAPFAAYYDAGDHQIISSSPELFLRLSGTRILTRPIKGTRARDPDPSRDAALSLELQSSPKENAELLMITDLLRNDLGRVCAFGSIHVPELQRLERYAQVQHLVSTVVGDLRMGVTHFQAFASCFPGGSITGAPKIRAMEIIDTLEPVSRGPYTGALGYLGFNRESQLSIAIRIIIRKDGQLHYHAGAGIVADSDPVAEYEETLAKARGFLELLANASAPAAIV